MRRLTCILCVGLAGMAAVSAPGQTLVLRLAGINGESQVTGHNKDIDIAGFSWGIASQSSGGGGTTVTLSPLTITKPVDLTSPTLAQKCASAGFITSGTLYCFRQQYGTNADFYHIALSSILVTSVQSAAPSFVPNRPMFPAPPTPPPPAIVLLAPRPRTHPSRLPPRSSPPPSPSA